MNDKDLDRSAVLQNIVFTAFANTAVTVALFSASAVLLKMPGLTFNSEILALIETIFLIILGFSLMIWNIVITIHKLKKENIHNVLFVIGGILFVFLIIQVTMALSTTAIQSAISALKTN